MRIGMFTNAYKPVISGVVRSLDQFRTGLRDAGHFVAMFAPEGRGYDDQEPFIFRYPAVPLPTDLEYTFPVVVAPQITWLLPRLKLDIIHSHHPAIIGKEALNFSRELDVPLVYTFHTLYHEYTHYLGLDSDIVRQLVKRLVGDYVRKADRIIAPSARVRDLLPSYGVHQDVEILPTPIDLSHFPLRERPVFSDPERIQLIYVGRLAKEKNLSFLIKAFARAVGQDSRLHLRIVGDGTERGKLESQVETLRINHSVTFAGAVPFDGVAAQLSTADMFVFASTTETQGLVVLEAMAAQLPLVLVGCPALMDCVRPDMDALMVSENEEDFAAAILTLARRPRQAQEMAANGRKNAENYSVPALSRRLVEIYQDTIAEQRGKPRA